MKTITIITLDVHGRDVVQRLIDEKVEGLEAFLWQQQLRFYWMNGGNAMDTEIRICDFKTKYFYEWIGNTGRLVITPLTDRCYVTLTMGLRLFLGGAPAGPAGMIEHEYYCFALLLLLDCLIITLFFYHCNVIL